MSEPDGTQASSYPSPGRIKTAHRKKVSPKPTQHPFDYRESEHSVRASWHKQKVSSFGPSLWQPFSQRRQWELNRENSRVYRLRYGSKSELIVEQLILHQRLIQLLSQEMILAPSTPALLILLFVIPNSLSM